MTADAIMKNLNQSFKQQVKKKEVDIQAAMKAKFQFQLTPQKSLARPDDESRNISSVQIGPLNDN